MRRYTDEELSRILSEKEGPGLARCGILGSYVGRLCMAQAAFATCSVEFGMNTDSIGVKWFDNNYDVNWAVDEFLAEMTKQGLA